MTVRELLERYLKEITPHKRSASTESYRVKALMARDIAHRTLAMLSSADIAAYRDERLKTVSTASVIRELNTIAHAIDIGRKPGGASGAEPGPRLIRRPAPPRGRDRRLDGDDEQRLLDAADAGRNTYMRPLIVLAIETAMRQGEMLSLTWVDINLDKRIAHLDLTKNGESQTCPSAAVPSRLSTSSSSSKSTSKSCRRPRAVFSKPGDTAGRVRDWSTCAFTICATRASHDCWNVASMSLRQRPSPDTRNFECYSGLAIYAQQIW